MLTANAINILLVLLPGFFSHQVLSILVPLKNSDKFNVVIRSLMLTTLIHMVCIIMLGATTSTNVVTLGENNELIFLNLTSSNSRWYVCLLATTILIIPIIISILIRTDFHMKIARWAHLTDRTGRSSVWQDIFTDKKNFILIEFDDSSKLLGWPQYYSDDPDDKMVYVYNPSWIDENGEQHPLNSDGVLVNIDSRVSTIQFLKDEVLNDDEA